MLLLLSILMFYTNANSPKATQLGKMVMVDFYLGRRTTRLRGIIRQDTYEKKDCLAIFRVS